MNKKFFGFVFAFVLLFSGFFFSTVNAIPPVQSTMTLVTEPGPTSNVDIHGATLSASWTWTGIKDGDTMPVTTVWFDYGTTSNSYDSNWKQTRMITANPTDVPMGSLTTDFDSILLPDTTYYYRAAARGNGNPYFGKILSFKTIKIEPVITTGDATDLKEDSAVLNGSWKDSYFPDFSISFEYGTSSDPTYWTKVDSTSVNKDFGSYTFLLKGLDSDTTYYYRATESSGNDDYFGEVKEFKTPESAAALAKVNSTTLSYSTVTDNSVRVKVSGYIAKGDYIFELYSQNTGEYAVPPIMYTNPINATAIEVSFTGLQPNYDYTAIFDKYTPGMIGNTDTAADVQFTTTGLPGSPTGATTVPPTTTPGTITSGPLPSTPTSGVVPDCGKVVTSIGADGKEVTTMNNPCTFKDLVQLINNVIKFLLFSIATPLIALILMYTGYLYLTAGGNSSQTEKVRHILFNAVIGYVVALAAWLIVKTILSSLNVTGIETFL